jgi:hypothetical protein
MEQVHTKLKLENVSFSLPSFWVTRLIRDVHERGRTPGGDEKIAAE